MHEFSLAEAVLEQAEAHAPPGAVIRSVSVRIGPLQRVDAEAFEMAWGAVTSGTRADGSGLQMQWPAAERVCGECGRRWSGGELVEPCDCGNPSPRWIGGDAMVLMSIEAEFADDAIQPAQDSNQERPS